MRTNGPGYCRCHGAAPPSRYTLTTHAHEWSRPLAAMTAPPPPPSVSTHFVYTCTSVTTRLVQAYAAVTAPAPGDTRHAHTRRISGWPDIRSFVSGVPRALRKGPSSQDGADRYRRHFGL